MEYREPDDLGMQHRVDDHGIWWFTFERAQEKVNLLDRRILEELSRTLDVIAGRGDLRGVVFRSAKPRNFLAGMDVDQIGSVTDAHQAAEAARFGQAVFQKIAGLSIPSVAAINGTCLGGGTELVLACDFRLAASDVSSLRIGLPETRLGIIPGFGGSQRLPRLLALPQALDMILTGRGIAAKKARRVGLVDLLVPAAYLDREAVRLIRRSADVGKARVLRKMRPGKPFPWRAVEGFGPARRYVIEQARKKTAAKVSADSYPAPFRALEAVEAAYTMPLQQGLDTEARIVGELIPSSTTKNLIWLFQSQNRLKSLDSLYTTPREVKRVGVLGAGIMGGGIAQLAADRGIPVRLKDIDYAAILTALRTAQGIWDKSLRRRRITRREAEQKMGLIAPTLDGTGLRQTDLVIEAVVEKLEIKQKVLADWEARVGDRAVFATNTSSLPIEQIAQRARRPERVVGMHFFNPVHRMPLVEVIASNSSSPEAIATVHALATRLGKIPIVVRDGPGFLVNRILSFYLNEAERLLAEGVRVDHVDRAMCAYGMPMGPFALLDQIGLDTAGHVAEVLREGLGPRAGSDTGLLRTMAAGGRMGKKSERGFYRYRQGRPGDPDPAVYADAGNPTPRQLPDETLQERMVLAMVNEAAICLEERVVRTPLEVDVAMVLGTGFPPFRGGLLRYADDVGIPIVVDRLARLADAHGERFRPAESLQQMVREQRRFHPRVESP